MKKAKTLGDIKIEDIKKEIWPRLIAGIIIAVVIIFFVNYFYSIIGVGKF